ncbi:E3 SUMO-protein ligase ZBED1-like [Sycon ciliatum]|uniref:E3 SUMO-protein ligase ZBED1-like n=1 Tax=Sycon ciliatum TaxID=27933 RepID=UPI0031F6CF16
MREHMKRAHPLLFGRCDGEKSSAKQSSMLQHVAVKPAAKQMSASTAKEITGSLTDWLVRDLRPLSIVDDVGFRDLMGRVSPGYVIPSRTHVSKLIGQRHTTGLSALTSRLKSVSGCCLTTDAWTSKATQSYNTVTVHFVTETWELESAVVETALFPGSHTGVRIAEKVSDATKRVGLKPAQVIAVVHDEARNAELAGRHLLQDHGWESVTCSAHLLQTCVRHVLEDSAPAQKLLSAARKLVGHFRHSGQATEALLAKQVQMGSTSPVKLTQDVPTRWNSAHDMLKRLVELRLPVMAVLTAPGQNRNLLLKDTQWTPAEQLTAALEPLKATTTVFGGQKYVTSSLVLPVVASIIERYSEPVKDTCVRAVENIRAALVSELQVKFRLSDVTSASPLVLAAALDPRFCGLKFTSHVLCEPDAIKAALAEEMKKHTAQPPSVVAQEPQAKRKPEDTGLQALLHGAVYDATAVENESPAQEVARYRSSLVSR